MIGASDAGAHLDLLATFNYATVLLGEAVREHGVLPLEEAVHLITDVPAQLYGLVDRGRLEVGHHADIVVFDPATVDTDPPSPCAPTSPVARPASTPTPTASTTSW